MAVAVGDFRVGFNGLFGPKIFKNAENIELKTEKLL
jgi:hypothetical protein